jgi:hypothetical protein
MKTVYLNCRTAQGLETVDQFTRGEDAPATATEFRQYIRQMIKEYHTAGMAVYRSIRPCKSWK